MKKKILMILFVMLLAFSFTGCKKEETKEEKEKKQEEKKKTDEKKTEEIKGKLVSDDKKIVFKQEPATYIVFYYEGEKLTSYAEYVDYVYPDQAEQATKGYDDDVKNKKYESVKAEGQYVVVTHNKSEYENWTLSVVKEAFKNYKIVK